MIPILTINGDKIPTAEDGEFKFLGMLVRLHSSNDEARLVLKESLQRMLSAIDESPLTRQQKLRLYKHKVCPRLSWPLLVEQSRGSNKICNPWLLLPSNVGLVLQSSPTHPFSLSQ